MSWRLAEFGEYFANVLGGKPTSFAKYRSFLNRTDLLANGLDELVAAKGVDGVRSWAKNQTEAPFDKFPSDARSIVNSYLGFLGEAADLDPGLGLVPVVASTNEPVAQGTVFKIEKEMQAAIRKDINALEHGLAAIDDGIEVSTPTGRVDILARDSAGMLTIIELKAGICPAGAIEQALGYHNRWPKSGRNPPAQSS